MKATCLAILALLIVTFTAQRTFSQTTDSSSTSSTSCGALQIQSVGGWGVYYIGDLSRSSFFRVGADLALNHSTYSGTMSDHFLYTSSSSSPSSDTMTEQPSETTNSYGVALSALYIQKLAEYKSTFLYCGVGPMFTYSWEKGTDSYPYTQTSEGMTTTSEYTENFTDRTSGIGPIAILGIRSGLVDHIGISAEVGLSAIYQWNTVTESSLSTTTSTGAIPYTSSENDNSNYHLNGWVVSLTSVRIGVVVGL